MVVKTRMKRFDTFCFIVLFLGLFFNIPSRICNDGISNFDWTSNGILISDLMYEQNYESDPLVLNSIFSAHICPEDWHQAEGIIEQRFINENPFEKEKFGSYTSNIVIQRFFYVLLDNILPISNENLLRVLEIVNCLLASLMVTIILSWIGSKSSYRVSLVLACLLAFFSPIFGMYGKNLYWCLWTIFMPMAGMIIGMKKIKRERNLAILAFFLCLLKQLFYFEFVSSVMVAMMIPLLYETIDNNQYDRKNIKKIAFSTVAALISFVTVFVIKLGWLAKVYSPQRAWEMTISNLLQRTTGNGVPETDLIPFWKLILLMCNKTMFSIKNIVRIPMGVGCVVLLFIILWYCLWYRKNVQENRLRAMVWGTVLSLAGPFSWFVLAMPHSTMHHVQCSITWFCPFVLMLCGTYGLVILEIKRLKLKIPFKMRKLLKSKITVIGLGVLFFIAPMIVHCSWYAQEFIVNLAIKVLQLPLIISDWHNNLSGSWFWTFMWERCRYIYFVLVVYFGWLIYEKCSLKKGIRND